VRKAIESPLRQLVSNAAEEGPLVVQEVKKGKQNYGYDVANGEYVDMIAAGIIDPAKVTRSALQNAASIAGLLLTTEAMVTELPEKEAPPAPDMGGMGGMM
jgi:chaperonin GroEL